MCEARKFKLIIYVRSDYRYLVRYSVWFSLFVCIASRPCWDGLKQWFFYRWVPVHRFALILNSFTSALVLSLQRELELHPWGTGELKRSCLKGCAWCSMVGALSKVMLLFLHSRHNHQTSLSFLRRTGHFGQIQLKQAEHACIPMVFELHPRSQVISWCPWLLSESAKMSMSEQFPTLKSQE